MKRRPLRVLAVDVPLAFLLGCSVLFATQARAAGFGAASGHGQGWRDGPGWDGGPPDFAPLSPLLYLGVLAATGAVATRGLWPRASLAVAAAGATLALAVAGGGPVAILVPFVLFSVAAAYPLRRWLLLTPLAVPILLAGHLDEPFLGLLNGELAGTATFGLAVLCAAAAAGAIVRTRREAARLHQEQERRRYAYEERLRIAREVHDVVGHSLSVISMQAGVALHVLDRRPEQIVPSLEAIRTTSKDALEELRGTLAVFRDPGDGLGGRAPTPGLDRLDDVVAALAAAGHTVEVAVEGEPVPLPAAVDHAAYRIVQESLTNVVRHAGSAAARVRLAYGLEGYPEGVIVEVTDDGSTRPGAPVVEGNGLAGMRERARAVGGTLVAGPRPDGGFAVRARLPVDRSER